MTSIRAVIVLAIAVVCESVSAADTARTQVMLVGTYHFSNPGKDIHKRYAKFREGQLPESRNEGT